MLIANNIPILLIFVTLMMEAKRSYETFVFLQEPGTSVDSYCYVHSLPILLTLMMEALRSSEKSVLI
jgi:hypothetical protein